MRHAASKGAQGLASSEARVRVAIRPLNAPENRYPSLFASALGKGSIDAVSLLHDDLGRGRNDIVLYHWPNEFFRPEGRKIILKLLGRLAADKVRAKTRFVWVVHNIEPHDGNARPSRLTRDLFFRLLDGLIFLSEHSRREFLACYPWLRHKPYMITLHGRYGDHTASPRPFTRQKSHHRLLFFGLVREYKNVERLVLECRRIEGLQFSLTVVGACTDPKLAESIRMAAGDDLRIRLDLRGEPLSDEELETVIDMHDAVVLPYRRILNSGVALHALGRNKPILAPAIGSLPELQQQVGAEWVHLFEERIEMADIRTFLKDISQITEAGPDLSAFDWEKIGADVTRFLCQLRWS